MKQRKFSKQLRSTEYLLTMIMVIVVVGVGIRDVWKLSAVSVLTSSPLLSNALNQISATSSPTPDIKKSDELADNVYLPLIKHNLEQSQDLVTQTPAVEPITGYSIYEDPVDPVSGWKVYTDDVLGIEFQYPPKWFRPQEGKLGVGVRIVTPSSEPDYDRSISFWAQPNPDKLPIRYFTSENDSKFPSEITAAEQNSQLIDLSIGSLTAYRLSQPYAGTGDVVFFEHKDYVIRAFVSAGGAHGGYIAEDNPIAQEDILTFHHILSTLRIIDSSGN